MRRWAGGDDAHGREVNDSPSLVLQTHGRNHPRSLVRIVCRSHQPDGVVVDVYPGMPHDGPVAAPPFHHAPMVTEPSERHAQIEQRLGGVPIKTFGMRQTPSWVLACPCV
jgi:hypothetical protein